MLIAKNQGSDRRAGAAGIGSDLVELDEQDAGIIGSGLELRIESAKPVFRVKLFGPVWVSVNEVISIPVRTTGILGGSDTGSGFRKILLSALFSSFSSGIDFLAFLVFGFALGQAAELAVEGFLSLLGFENGMAFLLVLRPPPEAGAAKLTGQTAIPATGQYDTCRLRAVAALLGQDARHCFPGQ